MNLLVHTSVQSRVKVSTSTDLTSTTLMGYDCFPAHDFQPSQSRCASFALGLPSSSNVTTAGAAPGTVAVTCEMRLHVWRTSTVRNRAVGQTLAAAPDSVVVGSHLIDSDARLGELRDIARRKEIRTWPVSFFVSWRSWLRVKSSARWWSDTTQCVRVRMLCFRRSDQELRR